MQRRKNRDTYSTFADSSSWANEDERLEKEQEKMEGKNYTRERNLRDVVHNERLTKMEDFKKATSEGVIQ